MLLKIYLATTAINMVTVLVSSVATANKLKRDGYVFVKENKSLSEKIMSYVSTIFVASIPIYNVINTIFILCSGEKVYDIMEEKLLRTGKIYMAEDTEDIEVVDENLQDSAVNLSSDKTKNVILSKSNNVDTNAEKIENLKNLREMLSGVHESSDEQVNPNTKPKTLVNPNTKPKTLGRRGK